MITLLQIGDRYVIPDRKIFLIDSEADISELEPETNASAPGSIAYTADMKIVYQLGNDRVWHKINM